MDFTGTASAVEQPVVLTDEQRTQVERKAALASMGAAYSAKLKAENEKQKPARNARRRAARHASTEYQEDLSKKRLAYAEAVGRPVRPYRKVETNVETERAEVRRERDRERKKVERTAASQADKDAEKDRKWTARQRAKGLSEEKIAEGLAERRAARADERTPPMERNPDWGRF